MPWITEATLDVHLGAAAAGWTGPQKAAACLAACGLIESYVGHAVQAADYSSWCRGWGDDALMFRHYPVIRVNRISLDTETKLMVTCRDTGAGDASLSIANGVMNLAIVGGVNEGTTPLTLSTYATMALLKVAIEAVPGSWTVTLQNEGVPRYLADAYVGGVTTGWAYLEGPDEGSAATWVPEELEWGAVRVSGIGGGRVYVSYRAGYEAASIPAVLTQVAHEVAADLLRQDSRDSGLESEKIEGYAWKARPERTEVITPYASRLDAYRRLAV